MKNLSKIIPIGLISLAVVTIALVLLFNLSGDKNKINKMLNLGMRYISEGMYEEAKLQFEKVLDIDDKNIEAMKGMVEALLGLEEEQSVAVYLDKCIIVIEQSSQEKLSDILETVSYIYYMKGLTLDNATDNSSSKESEKYYQKAEQYNELYKSKTGNDTYVKPMLDKVYKAGAGGSEDNSDNATPDNDMPDDGNSDMPDDNNNEEDEANAVNANFVIDYEGFKILGLSIYDLSIMSRAELVDYCRANANLSYGGYFEYDTDYYYLYQDQPIADGGSYSGWLMSVVNDEKTSWNSNYAAFGYSNQSSPGDNQNMVISINEEMGMRSLISCPNVPEMRIYTTVPSDFPPLDGGLEDIVAYYEANGIEYTNTGNGISHMIPKEALPEGYSSGSLYIDVRGGELSVQINIYN